VLAATVITTVDIIRTTLITHIIRTCLITTIITLGRTITAITRTRGTTTTITAAHIDITTGTNIACSGGRL